MSTDQDHMIWHVRCRPDTTADGHHRVLDLLGDFTPVVQPLPPLAALAQLRGASRLFQAAPGRLAARFRIQALAKYGIDAHIGIADTWATAATASTHPGTSGILHLPGHRAVEQFLAPLPVRALHGIGPAQAARLEAFGLHTIGALAAMDETVVCRVLGGKAGRILRDRARGIAPRAITARRMPESTSAFHAFDRDVYDPVLVRAALPDLVTTVGQRIRGREQIARKLTLAVRFADGSTVERTRALPQPSAHTDDLKVTVLRNLDSMAFQRADPPPPRDGRRPPPRRRRPRDTDLPGPRTREPALPGTRPRPNQHPLRPPPRWPSQRLPQGELIPLSWPTA
ncbi:hypothetical protein [Streptomyces zaomyceticus]|uniref:DNA polymerase Y family protein n=1 Tax=Streptomyces zaomyceticus TaxID=68286 RepID=UPI002F91776C